MHQSVRGLETTLKEERKAVRSWSVRVGMKGIEMKGRSGLKGGGDLKQGAKLMEENLGEGGRGSTGGEVSLVG